MVNRVFDRVYWGSDWYYTDSNDHALDKAIPGMHLIMHISASCLAYIHVYVPVCIVDDTIVVIKVCIVS
jgi:hypothetical protein